MGGLVIFELDVDLVLEIIGVFMDNSAMDSTAVCEELSQNGVKADDDSVAETLWYLVHRGTLEKTEDGLYLLDLGSAECPHCEQTLYLEVTPEADGERVRPGDKVLPYHLTLEKIECSGSGALPL